jgi:hypothetical protein
LAVKYFEDNWEKLAKSAIDNAKEALIKAVKSGTDGAGAEAGG